MSDERLRQLERRWRASGSVHDESGYLLERVRAGDLSRERLELAAYCGHQGARAASAGDAPAAPQGLGDWGRGLEPWGKEPCVRAALSAGWAQSQAKEYSVDAVRALRRALAWIRCPCQRHRALAREAAGRSSKIRSATEAALAAAAADAEGAASKASKALARAAKVVGEGRVRAAAQSDVASWALGNGDPVAQKIDALRDPGPPRFP